MKPLLLTLSILHGADAAETQVGLRNGLREANPLLPNTPIANLVMKSVTATASIWLITRVTKTNPRLAKVMAVVAIGLESYAVIYNARQLRRAR